MKKIVFPSKFKKHKCKMTRVTRVKATDREVDRGQLEKRKGKVAAGEGRTNKERGVRDGMKWGKDRQRNTGQTA